MSVEGPKGDVWELDPNLRTLAANLIRKYPEELGYVDLDKVMFVRCKNAPAQFDWLGKCFKLSTAIKLIPQYVAALMGRETEMDNLDLRYIIALNEDRYTETQGPADKLLEGIVFHELLHIDPDMEKLVKHNIQDFSSILDKFGVHWTSGQFKESDGVEGTS